MSQVDVIAIDGPVASGKGSVSSGVAKVLGFHVLDSGALYRLTALACMNQGMDLGDAAAAEKVARLLKPLFKDGKIYQNSSLSRRQKSFIRTAEKIRS